MDIDKIEKTISKLAKNGDRETIGLVIELLSEITKFKPKKSDKKPVNEDVSHTETPETPADRISRASAILDGTGSAFPEYVRRAPTRSVSEQAMTSFFGESVVPQQTSTLDIPQIPASTVMSNDSEMTDYASRLLW